jgi:fructose transport system ATP-binding protein
MTETPETSTRKVIFKARGLVKVFGRVVALDACDLDLYEGEVLAVIGDNGAGKSSLIKCLSGAFIPDEGTMELDGRTVTFKRPQDAQEAGVETVYQTLAVSPALDIASNMYLGREIRRKGPLGSVFRMLDRKSMRKQSEDNVKALGISTLQNVGQAVETLSGGQRQAVAVARAAAFGSKVIILDEPTAAVRRARVGAGPQDGQGSARSGHVDHPDQPQHAARVRGRRPDPRTAPRSPGGSDLAEDPHDE